MIVSPLRDGMNLVAKEFAASRVDGDGVLVLSEFAGAASELAEALLVNPYDIDGVADTLVRALTMPEDERRTRMRGMRERVAKWDVSRWASSFISAVEAAPVRESRPAGPAAERSVLSRVRESKDLVLLLDYDGTLVPFAETPELARPDAALLDLLAALAKRPRTSVHLVSGRSRDNLERWFSELPIGLHAEHGLWSRPPAGTWTRLPLGDTGWRDRVLTILEDFAERTPGSLVERKAAGFSWHYRAADPEYGPLQARELLLHLSEVLANQPVEVLAGEKVVEVRPHGVHKGRVVPAVESTVAAGALFVALGDDRTDDELFAKLPATGVRVRVGDRPGPADLVLSSAPAVREWLRRLC
jgi:trehalose 6-phosphate synthase/phosphatase